MAGEQRHPATVCAVVVALALTGCGGGASHHDARTEEARTSAEAPRSRSTAPTWHSSLSFRRDKSRVAVGVGADQRVCDLLRAPEVARAVRAVGLPSTGLRGAENDSYQLSICRYSGRGVVVRVLLDGAADATRRYFNMATEADQIPKLMRGRPDFRLVWGVGDDDTYGGAGAYWQPSSNRLVAILADRIVRVTVAAEGRSDRRRRVVASRLARRVLARANR